MRPRHLTFVTVLLLAFAVALGLRMAFQPADPPTHATVGITWHDEGVWAHNARNRVLFGAWRLDGWNPMYVSPVFTGLEWATFASLGVGLHQARLPSILLSALSVLALAWGVRAVGSRLSAMLAASFVATNYVYVMYGRVALLEATMVSLIVASWGCYAAARKRPALGAVAGVLAMAAFFTKASSAFFLVGIGLDCCWSLVRHAATRRRGGSGDEPNADAGREAAAALYTVAGLAAAGMAALAFFVVPNLDEYLFYNVRLYGERRSARGIGVVLDRASWLPIIHDFFTRMLLLTWISIAGFIVTLFTWHRRPQGERLLWLWLALGVLELILHDTGNERRFVFLIPAMAGMAALVLGRDFRLLPEGASVVPLRRVWWAAPVVAYGLYVAWGAVARLPYLYQVRPGVRIAAVLAVVSLVGLIAGWRRGLGRLLERPWTPQAAVALALVIVGADLVQYGQWSWQRTYKNVAASRAVGRLLPWGTPVLGKLANGMSLENGIRPLYIGQGFGNYADTHLRDTVPYVLTYTSPRLGYEGPAIREVLEKAPGWRIVARFPVAETPGGTDMAVLIEKPLPDGAGGR
jgi:4-amino-4-deoxy-L-arabinose transferase-like glycosyltransferase